VEMRKPSRTAVNAAVRRAAHALLDDEPKILVDPLARAFAGFDNDEALLAAHAAHPAARVPGVRTRFAVRNRYAEDELAAAVGRGIGQHVILGAGLDSFAYRCPAGCARSRCTRWTTPLSVEAGAGRRTRPRVPARLAPRPGRLRAGDADPSPRRGRLSARRGGVLLLAHREDVSQSL
jgi:Leucine carboxyl methyltransferase